MQKIADYLIDTDEIEGVERASELAQRSGVSTASVSRFVKMMGYKEFRDFRLPIVLEKQGEEKRQAKSELNYNGETISGDAYSICKTIFSKSVRELEETWGILDFSLIQKVADLIHKARRIAVIGVGRSKITVEALFSRLYRIGYPIMKFSDSHEIVNITSILEEKDLLICVSNFGLSKSVVEGAKRAKKRGIKVVGISSIKESPLSKVSDYTLFSAYDYNAQDGNLFDPSSENLAQLVMVDCIYMLVARKNEKKNISYFKTFSNEIHAEHVK
ncbi:MurR/RpiR family transcriptional regulator [Oribacterium parvum]